jgi:Tol biopolymer transport system component
MNGAGFRCSHCGTINIVSGAGCIKCGWWLPSKSGNVFRRRFLIASGAFLVGCFGLNDALMLLSGPLFPDKHLFFEMDWLEWFSFAWLSDNKHLICLKWTGELAILDIRSKRMSFLKSRAWDEDLTNFTILHAWSNDRKYLAYSKEFHGVAVLDLESGEHVQVQEELFVNAFAWSPDGSQFAYLDLGIEEGVRPVLSVWNRQGWKLAWKKDVYNEKNVSNRNNYDEAAFSWSPDGKYISFSFNFSPVFNSSFTLYVWRVSDGQQLWTQEFFGSSSIDKISWSADSSALAVSSLPLEGDGSLCQGSVWDLKGGQKLFESQLVNDSNNSFFGYSMSPAFAWSPNGARLAFFVQAHGKYVMRVWDRHVGGYLFSSSPLDFSSGSISWSPNGRFIAAGNCVGVDFASQSIDGTKSTIQFWNAQNGQELTSYSAPRLPTSLTWSADSRFLVVINKQTATCGRHGCMYDGGNGVGSERLQSAFQIFQAPDTAS